MSKGSLRYANEDAMPEGMRRLLRAGAATKLAQVKRSQVVAPDPVALSWPQRHARHEAGVMNKTEARFAQQLEADKRAGDIAWYGFEAVKFRIAKRTWLTVDFLVKHANGEWAAIDVKGRKGNRYWAEEDAMIKLKVAAETFPMKFGVVWPLKGGGWGSEVIG